jgi:cytochrome oxidase Cu insertion factor (SCO1/SenC/PrrC family)
LSAIGLTAVLTVVLGASLSRAQSAPLPELDPELAKIAAFERSATPYSERFPNVVLKTHEGKNVRFYDDLLKDKIVLINFFYVTCSER